MGRTHGGCARKQQKNPRLAFPADAIPTDVGSTVAGARRGRRWSQARLASKARVARASIYRLEAGGHAVRPGTLFRVAHALRLEMRELVPDWPEWEPVSGSGHGARTRERRRALGLSLAELAAAAGVSEATLSRHERGIGRSPDLVRLVGDEPYACNRALAKALGFRMLGEFEAYCSGTD